MLDGEEATLVFKMRVLTQILRVADHYIQAGNHEEESEDIQELVDCCLLQVIWCIFPAPNDAVKPMDRAQILFRRDLLRQALQILCDRRNSAAGQDMDKALSDEIIQRTTKLWDAMTA